MNELQEIVEMYQKSNIATKNELLMRYTSTILKEVSRYNTYRYDLRDLIQHGYLAVIHSINSYNALHGNFNNHIINSIKQSFRDLASGKIIHNRDMADTLDCKSEDGIYQFTLEDLTISWHEALKLQNILITLPESKHLIIEKSIIEEVPLSNLNLDFESDFNELYQNRCKITKDLNFSYELVTG